MIWQFCSCRKFARQWKRNRKLYNKKNHSFFSVPWEYWKVFTKKQRKEVSEWNWSNWFQILNGFASLGITANLLLIYLLYEIKNLSSSLAEHTKKNSDRKKFLNKLWFKIRRPIKSMLQNKDQIFKHSSVICELGFWRTYINETNSQKLGRGTKKCYLNCKFKMHLVSTKRVFVIFDSQGFN